MRFLNLDVIEVAYFDNYVTEAWGFVYDTIDD
jgi:hypothetical protein